MQLICECLLFHSGIKYYAGHGEIMHAYGHAIMATMATIPPHIFSPTSQLTPNRNMFLPLPVFPLVPG